MLLILPIVAWSSGQLLFGPDGSRALLPHAARNAMALSPTRDPKPQRTRRVVRDAPAAPNLGELLRNVTKTLCSIAGPMIPPLYFKQPSLATSGNWTLSLDVTYSARITTIKQVDFVAGRVSLIVEEELSWYDPRLTYDIDHEEWESNRCLQMTTNEFSGGLIWLPELHVTNHAYDYYHETHTSIFPACVYSETYAKREGVNVRWSKLSPRVFSCLLLFDAFPFDEQFCEMRLSIIGSNKHMHLVPLNLNGIDYKDSSFKLKFLLIDDSPQSLSIMLQLARRPEFHVNYFFLPMALTGAMAYFSFWVHFVYNDRISYCLTLLWALYTIVARTSEYRPEMARDTWFDAYQGILLLFAAAPAFEALLVVGVKHRIDRHNATQTTRYINRRKFLQRVAFLAAEHYSRTGHKPAVEQAFGPMTKDLTRVCSDPSILMDAHSRERVVEAALPPPMERDSLALCRKIDAFFIICFPGLLFAETAFLIGKITDVGVESEIGYMTQSGYILALSMLLMVASLWFLGCALFILDETGTMNSEADWLNSFSKIMHQHRLESRLRALRSSSSSRI
ncbi:MAG: uncharacterized protein KVP18_000677 [Porospora cf. gigantea A]|uniref:uncharacterized protein n=2 Tax=Porospora cf. gigantea A TaxID=2853593 RepID=UPI003559D211|nr:MAG: hypothetical protein KVP18_000677 [Porospora cf. gigantea A]